MQKTHHLKSAILSDTASMLYLFLQSNLQYTESIRSKKGFTRLAAGMSFEQFIELLEDYPEVKVGISETIEKYCVRKTCKFVYINYYVDGNMWCPNHKHPGTTQLILSLGTKRTFEIAKKSYEMANGDIIVFGASSHGIPKSNVTDGRIGVALFLEP